MKLAGAKLRPRIGGKRRLADALLPRQFQKSGQAHQSGAVSGPLVVIIRGQPPIIYRGPWVVMEGPCGKSVGQLP